tara:strand:+ start:1907 stop:2659 length:753 start_codon:yes stop_codon:yes gene_type:complete
MTEPFCEEYVNNKNIACGVCMKDNLLFPMFFLVSFIPFTILFSSWVVAKFVFLPHVEMAKNEKEIEWPEEEEIVKYEEKYPIIEKNVKNEDLDTDKCCVCESTPDGLVFMKYNKKNEIFDWWGDNKSVSYKYLETVARKYVNSFKCSNFYIDREEDLKQQIEKEKAEEERKKMEDEDKKEEEVDSDDDLFVKLKPNEKIKPKKKGEKAAINGNKYKYCGKIKDFKLLKKIENKKKKKKLDFSSWKSMLSN